jgi:4-amino-4-deoxy-L-arabinose transferase-like glycosyltransferase
LTGGRRITYRWRAVQSAPLPAGPFGSVLTGVRPYLLLLLVCLGLYLPGLAGLPPLDRDEARFAQASKQMLESGNFVDIRFQDTPRHKKPIGVYWLQAAAVTVTGADLDAIWAYRLPSVVGATLAALMLFRLGRRLFDPPTAFLAAALLATSLMVVMEAHQAKTDAVLLATVVAAQWALASLHARARGIDGARAGALTAAGFWVAQGLGILVKGPVTPMVSLLTVLALVAVERRAGWLRTLRPISGMVITTAIVAPWTWAVMEASGGTFFTTAVQSDLLPKLIGGQESHGAPPGYYALLVLAFLWPGSLLLVPALVAAWRHRAQPAVLFCLAWLVPGWIAFELIPTKLPHYVLPLYPALALLISRFAVTAVRIADSIWVRRGFVPWAGLWSLFGLAVAAAAMALPVRLGDGWTAGSLVPAAAAVTAVAAALWLLRRGAVAPALVAAIALGGLAWMSTLQLVAPRLTALWVTREVAAMVDGVRGDADPPLAVAGLAEPSLVFLLGTATQLVDGTGGARFLADHADGLIVVSDREEQAFRAALAPAAAPAALGSVSGLQYSKGRQHRLTLYRGPVAARR